MRDPDNAGVVGRAWKWTAPEGDDDPSASAEVATWFLTGPFHPYWSWWLIMCVDLIDRPGQPTPHLQFPGAEYEIIILSLDPKWEPDVDAKPGQVPYLTPPDLAYQLEGVSREAVADVVELMVRSICDGKASPDSDYRGWWQRALTSTIDHYKAGEHTPGDLP